MGGLQPEELEKNGERKCLQINVTRCRRTGLLCMSVQQDKSEELYAVHPQEILMWLEKKKPYYQQAELSASLAPMLPPAAVCHSTSVKGFPSSDK